MIREVGQSRSNSASSAEEKGPPMGRKTAGMVLLKMKQGIYVCEMFPYKEKWRKGSWK